MDAARQLDLSDLNLLEFNRESARATPGGVVHEEDGLVCFAPGHRFPFGMSGAMRTERRLPAAEFVARARAFFGDRGGGFTFWPTAHRDADVIALLEADGMTPFGNSPGMVLDRRLPDAPAPAGATIEQVVDARGVEEFGAVSGAAYATYGMPPAIGAAQFARPESLLRPHVAAFLARVDGVAVAAAMAFVTHDVAGVYWVGTTPEARGRGLAEAVTRRATNAGFDLGGRFGALQASVMGEPIYRRMGWREITRYPWYVVL